MAIGDIVSGKIANSSTWAYFQPAAAVEIMITAVVVGLGTDQYLGMYDGTDKGTGRVGMSGNFSISGMQKMGITNTNYLATYTTDTYSFYSGIQIK